MLHQPLIKPSKLSMLYSYLYPFSLHYVHKYEIYLLAGGRFWIDQAYGSWKYIIAHTSCWYIWIHATGVIYPFFFLLSIILFRLMLVGYLGKGLICDLIG